MGITWCAYVIVGLKINKRICRCSKPEKFGDDTFCYNCQKSLRVKGIEIMRDKSGDTIIINENNWKMYFPENEEYFYIYLSMREVTNNQIECTPIYFAEIEQNKLKFESDMKKINIYDPNNYGIHLIMEDH